MTNTVLIVDDDNDLRTIVRDVLKEEGFATVEAQDGMQAVRIYKNDLPDVVILDLNMPYMNGMETLLELRRIDQDVPIIILTAFGDIPTAVEAIKNGAYDFAVKPPEFDRLLITLRRAIEKRALEQQADAANMALNASLENLLGKSEAMTTVINQIKQVAMTNFSVIVQGETGTGKSMVAGVIQGMSRRADRPFVSVDIGLIPDHLVESELFGYKKGAFTGAEKDKTGYFETAGNGTIFLDELENMSSHVQAKLLSFIDRKKIYPLGGTTPVDIDVRIIAATNKDIRECVSRKEFREDLFYRLGEFIISLPPLRDRKEDIPFFANKFLYEACAELNKQVRGISDEALDLLHKHNWPGNLRELRNIIRKAVLLTPGDTLNRECMEIMIRGRDAGMNGSTMLSLKDALREEERRMIMAALGKAGDNKAHAAELLDISISNLYSKMKEYGIEY